MKLAVIGDPVAHSASPELHRAFFAEAGIDGTYEAIRVPAGEGARAIQELRESGYRGLNVTTPLKEEAFAACKHTDEVSRHAGSVNTIVFEPGIETLGCNTDGIGALDALGVALGVETPPPETRVLVLGAGPTARACAYVLSRVGMLHVLLWNRTEGRGQDLAERFALESWTDQNVDVAFAALPPDAELDDDIRRALWKAPLVIDANYGERATLGAALGRQVLDGLPMLRASARASFDLWRDAESPRRGGDSNSRDL